MRKLLLYAGVLLAASCANRVAPTGGEKDVTPPKLISAEPEDHSLHFNAKTIRLKFDEYVTVNDLQNQMIVSPLTVKLPTVKTGKRELLIEVPDSLQPNTTYTVNFGKAIVDVHEANPLEDFRYVFSTGDFIDSLELSGEVRDAAVMTGYKKVTVLVYRKNGQAGEDSLPFTRKPHYFARTNDKGMFRISNMAEGTYYLFAVEDKNGNYFCDRPSEEPFGFYPRSIQLPGDSIVVLKAALEYPAAVRMTRMSRVDRRTVQIYFNQPDQPIELKNFDGTALAATRLWWNPTRDSVTVFDPEGADSLKLLMYCRDQVFDTLQVRLIADKGAKEAVLKNRVKIVSSPQDQGPKGKLLLQSDHPLKQDTILIQLQEDSSKVVEVPLKMMDAGKGSMAVEYPWKENANYRLTLPAGRLMDVFGATTDTARFSFHVPDEKSTAILSVKIEGLNGGSSYIFQLLTDKMELLQQVNLTGDSTLLFQYLQARTARIRVLHDVNRDGHWTPGNYSKKVQPEPVFIFPDQLTLRANWELETVIKPVFE